MRFKGILRRWDDKRGFGFIAPTDGGREIFVHIGDLPSDGTRPTEGESLSFELGTNPDGKPNAVNVHRTAFGPPPAYPNALKTKQPRRGGVVGAVVALAVTVAGGTLAYKQYVAPNPPTASMPTGLDASSGVDSFRSEPAGRLRPDYPTQEPALSRSSTAPAPAPALFQCDGRTMCSQMASCAEATFFLNNCPDTRMDGNRDGVPCEQQWCRP